MPTLPPVNFKPIVSPQGVQPLGARANAAATKGQNKYVAPNTMQGAANPAVPGGPPQIQAAQAGQKAAAVAKPKVMPHNPLRGSMSKGASKMTKQQQLKISGLFKLAMCSEKMRAKKLKKKAIANPLLAAAGVGLAFSYLQHLRRSRSDADKKLKKKAGIADAVSRGATGVGQATAGPLAKLLKLLGAKDTSNKVLANKTLSKSKTISLPSDVKSDATKSMRNLGLGAVGAGAVGVGAGLPLALRKGKGSDAEKEACVRGMLEAVQPTEAELKKFAAKLPKGTNVKQAYATKVAGFWWPLLAALGLGTVAPHAIGGLSTLASKVFDPYTYIPPSRPIDKSRYGGMSPADESLFRRGAMQHSMVSNQTRDLLGAYNQATRPEYYQ